jgi:UDP-glucose 4-epimerase
VKVLVVGTGGALARQVALLLKDRGHQVMGLDSRPWFDAPRDVKVFETDLRKRGAEDVFRTEKPQCVVHMATVNALAAGGEARARLNMGGTKAVFENSIKHGVNHVVFLGRHTYYGASLDSPLYHSEQEPPQGIGRFPELADLVAADLFAANMLWREPQLITSVLRVVYTLGPSQSGTLSSFLKGKRVPMVLGFDPLFHFLDEGDAAHAVALTVEKRPKGIFNVAGPGPVPLGTIIRESGRQAVPLPEFVLKRLLGRAGFPKLPRGAVEHVKYPIVVDATEFKKATGFVHEVSETDALRRYRRIISA